MCHFFHCTGKLEKSELGKLLKHVSQVYPELAHMSVDFFMKSVDKDGSGEITELDFTNWFKNDRKYSRGSFTRSQ